MSIRKWPQAERPRGKLINKGPNSLSDAELLAIFLRTGVAGKSAVELAREILAGAGGLRALLNMSLKRLYIVQIFFLGNSGIEVCSSDMRVYGSFRI